MEGVQKYEAGKRTRMASTSYSCRQIIGTSDISVDDAISRALNVARQSFREPDWFDVVTARGFISNGQVTHYQVTLNLGYENDRPDAHCSASNDSYFRAACSSGARAGVYHTVEARF